VNDAEIDRVARMSVKSAVLRARHEFCEQDFEDMLQEAKIAIYQSPIGKPESYYFVAGRTKALNWVIWWKYGATRDKLIGLFDSIYPIEPIDNLEKCQPSIVRQRSGLRKEKKQELSEIFKSTRKKKNASKSIERDISICNYLCSEYNNLGISNELSINIHTVSRFRELIRKRLIKYCDENNIQI